MALFANLEGRLSRSVGNNQDNKADDVRLIKRNLNRSGYFDEERDSTDNPIITRDMDFGVKAFQRDYGLKVDGILKPGGETERGLFEVVNGRSADDARGRRDSGDDLGEVGFGGNVSGALEQKTPAKQQHDQDEKAQEKDTPPIPPRKPESPGKEKPECSALEFAYREIKVQLQLKKNSLEQARYSLKRARENLKSAREHEKKDAADTKVLDIIGRTIGGAAGGVLGKSKKGVVVGKIVGKEIVGGLENIYDVYRGEMTDSHREGIINQAEKDIEELPAYIANVEAEVDEIMKLVARAKQNLDECKSQ